MFRCLIWFYNTFSYWLVWFCCDMILFYRYALSPWLGVNCRFQPSCSQFATEALIKYGIKGGIKLILKRLLRCHPWGGCGYDPVS